MQKRFMRALAAFLCVTLLISGNGISAFAEVSGNDVSSEDSQIVVSEENDDTVIEEEEEVIVNDEECLTYTDEFGYSFEYSPAKIASYNYDIDVTSGELKAITDGEGKPVKGNVVIPDNLGITAIGDEVFYHNTDITYVVIPTGVYKIGEKAFAECSNLKGVTLPHGLEQIGSEAFYKDTALIQISFPKSVTIIDARAFKDASNLYLVRMTDIDYCSLTTISDEAFSGCKSLTYFCSESSQTFPERVQIIGEKAFYGCEALTELKLPRDLTELGSEAFSHCSKLIKVVLSSSYVSKLNDGTFSDCKLLTEVNIKDSELIEIGNEVFKNCYSLGTIDLPNSLKVIGSAFDGCSNLSSVHFYSKIGSEGLLAGIFPKSTQLKGKLYVYGPENSGLKKYIADANNSNIIFVANDKSSDNDRNLYNVKTHIIKGSGKIAVVDAAGKEIDTTKVKGFEAGELVYITVTPGTNLIIKSGTLKMNGTKLSLKDGKYSFEMPKGGATITVEFVSKAEEKRIKGTEFDVLFSHGEVSQVNPNVITLSKGSQTKVMLVDTEEGSVISAGLITFAYADTKKKDTERAATISTSGLIKAVAKGIEKFTVSVEGEDGDIHSQIISVEVLDAKIARLSVKVSSYDDSIFDAPSETSEGYGIIRASAGYFNNDTKKIKLKATAYDAADDTLSVPIKWSTTDKKVAAVSDSTSMTNTITIPKGANGEATITATANITDKKTIETKFIISIADNSPRLIASTVTVNLNKEEAGFVKIMEAYSGRISKPSDVKFQDMTDFALVYDEERSMGSGALVYRVEPVRTNTAEGKYKEKIVVPYDNVAGNPAVLSVTLDVKRTKPSPKVSMPEKVAIDTLYKNDGTEIVPKITSLGSNKITKYELAALSTSKNDKKFLENFQIDEHTGVITQKAETLLKGSDGKYVVKGKLVMHFEGYKDTVTVSKKITIPIKTSAVSYKLQKKTITINDIAGSQELILKVLDTKKKNAVVDLSQGGYEVTVLAGSIIYEIRQEDILPDGIHIRLDSIKPGKIKLKITNEKWASKSVKLTYTVKTSSKAPKISLSAKTVSINRLFPENEKTFTLKSDQYDTILVDEQSFVPQNKKDINKLSVTYDSETHTGHIKILDKSIKNGEYKFSCRVKRINTSGQEVSANKVTLTVKVVSTKPTVTLNTKKVTINRTINNSGSYSYESTDVAVIKTKIGKLPAGYVIDDEATEATLKCTTKNKASVASKLDLTFTNSGKEMNVWLNTGEIANGTYNIKLTPKFTNGENVVSASAVTFDINVMSGNLKVKFKAAGKINLIDRVDPDEARAAYAAKPSKLLFNKTNSIIYTPEITNFNDKIDYVEIFDANDRQPNPEADEESSFFNATVLGKKVYVTPKAGVNIESGKNYKIMLYAHFSRNSHQDTLSTVLTVKAEQNLPKVKADNSTYNLYLSNKNKTVSFTVKPESGKLESAFFATTDKKALASFDITSQRQENGTLLVTLRLKDSVSYAVNSTNNIAIYVTYEGQGAKTGGVKAVKKIKINR